jgi:uncharacterized protein YcbK (DUF882 family)
MLKKEDKTQMQITKNFAVSELEFYDKIPKELLSYSKQLLENLQILRDHFGKPITIISGYRSPSRNNAVNGKSKSLHLWAAAADIQVKDVAPSIVYKTICDLIKSGKMYNGGVGVYPNFVHYDVRSSATGHTQGARWHEKDGD